VAIINDKHKNIKVNGVEVYTLNSFKELAIECEVAILDNSIELKEIYEDLNALGILNIKVASDYGDYGADLKDVSVEDLLARHPKKRPVDTV